MFVCFIPVYLVSPCKTTQIWRNGKGFLVVKLFFFMFSLPIVAELP